MFGDLRSSRVPHVVQLRPRFIESAQRHAEQPLLAIQPLRTSLLSRFSWLCLVPYALAHPPTPNSILRTKNNEFLGNVSADLTGSHLDAATGRDEVAVAADAKDGDSDDDDDDDENEVGARAARQAASVKGGQAAGGGGAEGEGTSGGRASSDVIAAAVKAAVGGGGGVDAGLDGEVKELERNKLVRTFFRGLLKEWEMDLNKRPDQVKRTVQGKLETKTQKQAKDYMRPLFKLCKQKVVCVYACMRFARFVVSFVIAAHDVVVLRGSWSVLLSPHTLW